MKVAEFRLGQLSSKLEPKALNSSVRRSISRILALGKHVEGHENAQIPSVERTLCDLQCQTDRSQGQGANKDEWQETTRDRRPSEQLVGITAKEDEYQQPQEDRTIPPA